MLRMFLAAATTMTTLLLAGLFWGQPAEQPAQPIDSDTMLARPKERLPLTPFPTPVEVQRRLTPEMSSILEARRRFGSALEGTSLDDQTADDDFVESLEQLLRR